MPHLRSRVARGEEGRHEGSWKKEEGPKVEEEGDIVAFLSSNFFLGVSGIAVEKI